MINRRNAVAGLLFSFTVFQMRHDAVAAEPSARDFLAGIYAAYKGNSDKSRGIPLTDGATVRRYFEPQIAALIIKDMETAGKRQDVPLLDGDPFIDAQDWDVGAFDISVRDTGAGKAAGTVAFKNFGAPVTIGLELVKLKDGWRIADILWGEERGSLKALYARR